MFPVMAIGMMKLASQFWSQHRINAYHVEGNHHMAHRVTRRHALKVAAIGVPALTIGLPISPGIAQSDPVPATGNGEFPGLDQMPGLQSVVNRGYMAASAAEALFATPTPDEAAWVGLLSITIATFDSPDDAEAARPAFQTIAESHMAMAFADTPAASMEGIDDDAALAAAIHFADYGLGFGENMWAGGALARFDASLMMAIATGFGNPPIDDAWNQVRDVIIAVGEAAPGDGEPTYVYDGTSTGGDWDRLPPADDPILGVVGERSIYGPTDTALFPEFLYF